MRGINYEKATQYISEIINLARERQLSPLSIVVIDNGGHIKCSASEDGVGILRHEIAYSKAYACLGMTIDNKDLYQLNKRGILSDAFINSIASASHGKFNINPGGALIYQNNNIIGAIGVSGGSADQDEKVIRTVLAEFK